MIYLKELQPYGFWSEIGHGLSTIGHGFAKGVSTIFKPKLWEKIIPPTQLGLQIWLTSEQIKALKNAGYSIPSEEPGYYQIAPASVTPAQPAQPTQPAVIPRELYYVLGGGVVLLLAILLIKKK